MHHFRFLCTKGPGGSGLFCTDSVSPPTSLRSVSLLQADCPERVLKPAGLGILSQRKPRCLAALCTGKFLGRYGGAIYGPTEPADDDQDIAHNNLHGHGLRRPRSDLVPDFLPHRHAIYRAPLNGEFVDVGRDCCLPRKRKAKRLRMDNRRKSFRLDVSLLAAPRQGCLALIHDSGAERSCLIEGALACAGCSRHRDKIPSVTHGC